jgi:hypothetical protein
LQKKIKLQELLSMGKGSCEQPQAGHQTYLSTPLEDLQRTIQNNIEVRIDALDYNQKTAITISIADRKWSYLLNKDDYGKEEHMLLAINKFSYSVAKEIVTPAVKDAIFVQYVRDRMKVK